MKRANALCVAILLTASVIQIGAVVLRPTPPAWPDGGTFDPEWLLNAARDLAPDNDGGFSVVLMQQRDESGQPVFEYRCDGVVRWQTDAGWRETSLGTNPCARRP